MNTNAPPQIHQPPQQIIKFCSAVVT